MPAFPRLATVARRLRLLPALMLWTSATAAENPEKVIFTGIGMGAAIAAIPDIQDQGVDFLTLGVVEYLMPDKPEEAFEAKLAEVKKCPLPVRAVNGFLTASHRCIGPEANHDEVMKWAETVFRRAEKAGVDMVVFGSSKARRLPEGWPREKGVEQFVALLKRMGPAAQRHGVTVVVEQLQKSECNFLNHISDLAGMIRAANHPNVRALADLHHISRVDDTPADLRAAMDVVIHVEIAEKAERTIPGVKGDDFRPFFRVLRDSGYKGLLNIEGHWKPGQIANSVSEIRKQEADVMAEQ